jgi:hypothetical protein
MTKKLRYALITLNERYGSEFGKMYDDLRKTSISANTDDRSQAARMSNEPVRLLESTTPMASHTADAVGLDGASVPAVP